MYIEKWIIANSNHPLYIASATINVTWLSDKIIQVWYDLCTYEFDTCKPRAWRWWWGVINWLNFMIKSTHAPNCVTVCVLCRYKLKQQHEKTNHFVIVHTYVQCKFTFLIFEIDVHTNVCSHMTKIINEWNETFARKIVRLCKFNVESTKDRANTTLNSF